MDRFIHMKMKSACTLRGMPFYYNYYKEGELSCLLLIRSSEIFLVQQVLQECKR